jgi:hypothetical protein
LPGGHHRALRSVEQAVASGLALRYDGGSFIQTLKEQVLWMERFDTLEELRAAVRHLQP